MELPVVEDVHSVVLFCRKKVDHRYATEQISSLKKHKKKKQLPFLIEQRESFFSESLNSRENKI